MTPKQSLKFLIKEHVKQLLEGGLSPAPPESVAASRDMADRFAAIRAQGMGTGHGAAVLADYRAAETARATARAEQDEKIKKAAELDGIRAKSEQTARAEQDEKIKKAAELDGIRAKSEQDDDKIIDRAIAYYNTGAGGWDGQDAARLAGEMTAKQKLRKGRELEQAKRKWQKEKDQASAREEADYRNAYNKYHGLNGYGSSGG